MREELSEIESLFRPLSPEERAAAAAVEEDHRRRSRDLVNHCLTLHEAATHLGVSEDEVLGRLRAQTLYGFEGDGRWLLPRIQFTDDGEVERLAEIHRHLAPGILPLTYVEFLLRPSDALCLDGEDLSPWDWLARGGRIRTVVHLVQNL